MIHGSVSQSPDIGTKTKSKTKKRKVADSFTVPDTDSPILSWNIADNDALMPLDGEGLGPTSTLLHHGGGEFRFTLCVMRRASVALTSIKSRSLGHKFTLEL